MNIIMEQRKSINTHYCCSCVLWSNLFACSKLLLVLFITTCCEIMWHAVMTLAGFDAKEEDVGKKEDFKQICAFYHPSEG